MRIYEIFIVVLTAALCCACNNDIFVDKLPAIESDIHLDGNGGSCSFKYQKKGLLKIALSNSSGLRDYTNYYNADGELLSYDAQISEIRKLEYGSPRFTFELRLQDDKITVTSLDNTSHSDMEIWLSLDYGYTVVSTAIHVSPGTPMIIKEMGYDMQNPITGIMTEKSLQESFSNNSDSPLLIVLYPFKDARSRIELRPEEVWDTGIKDVCTVPLYDNGAWDVGGTDKTGVVIGATRYFYSVNTNVDEAAYVEIPANSSVTIVMHITYATLETAYIAEFVQPNSGIGRLSSGKCIMAQPIRYNVEMI